MDILVLFTILFLYVNSTHSSPNSYPYPSSVLKYKRRNEGPSHLPNLIGFFILFVFSLVGAIGLTIRGASRGGKGLCEDFASGHPKNCTKATVAVAVAWVSVVFGMSSTSLVPCLVSLIIP